MRKPVCQYDFRDADLRSHGCTLASLAYAAREMTDGAAWIDPEHFAGRLQKLSDVSLATFRERGTTLTEGKRAYEAAPGFEGRVAPRLALQRGIDVREQLLPMLREDHIAVVAVNYGRVQDGGKGVGSFRGGHAVTIGEPDGTHVTVADPLRRELVRWRISLLVEAMETFGKKPWGNGRGEAAVPLPSPTFLERAIAQRDRARAMLSDEQQRSARLLQENLEHLERNRTLADQLAACEALTPPDCTEPLRVQRESLLSAVSDGVDALIAGLRAEA